MFSEVITPIVYSMFPYKLYLFLKIRSSNQWYLLSQVFYLKGLIKRLRIPWGVILPRTIEYPLVCCWCKKTVSRICRSSITFFAFLKVPPVSDSVEE